MIDDVVVNILFSCGVASLMAIAADATLNGHRIPVITRAWESTRAAAEWVVVLFRNRATDRPGQVGREQAIPQRITREDAAQHAPREGAS